MGFVKAHPIRLFLSGYIVRLINEVCKKTTNNNRCYCYPLNHVLIVFVFCLKNGRSYARDDVKGVWYKNGTKLVDGLTEKKNKKGRTV